MILYQSNFPLFYGRSKTDRETPINKISSALRLVAFTLLLTLMLLSLKSAAFFDVSLDVYPSHLSVEALGCMVAH